MPLLEIRLRPAGPWRTGQRAGDRERVDSVYHSDALFSAVTHAMSMLGWLDEWLDATARQGSTAPVVNFTSLFPFIGDARLIPPPRTSWPPSGAGKLYVKGAKLVPLEVACNGVVNESRWAVDGASECLLPAGTSAPFAVAMHSAAAVDRITGHAEPHRTACLEFAPDAGWWGLIDIGDEGFMDVVWEPRVKAAFRLLADSGFGGERSRGWGRAGEPQFTDASGLFAAGHPNAWWMLSLYSPHEDDAVDWARGDYAIVTRAGWTDTPAGSARKKPVRMIEEGSVLTAASKPRGRAVDVAPEGFAHPAWRAGFAFAVPVPLEAEV